MSAKISDLNNRLFRMEREVDNFIGECQSGLVREETFQAVVASIRAVTGPHAGNYLVPKHAVMQLFRLVSYLGDDAPRAGPSGQRMMKLTRETWDLISDILKDGVPPVSLDQDPTSTDDFDWGDAP